MATVTERLAAAARERAVPLLPGTATASEVMAAREAGFLARRAAAWPGRWWPT